MGIVNTDHIESLETDEIPSAESKAPKHSFRCFCVKEKVQELQSGSHREEERPRDVRSPRNQAEEGCQEVVSCGRCCWWAKASEGGEVTIDTATPRSLVLCTGRLW